MPPPVKSVFRHAAIASRLVTPEQLEAALRELRAATGGPPTPMVEISDQALADRLVQKGVLTPYQSTQLRDGKTKLRLGPYIITDWIGQGGMGHVFKAVHEVMGRESAVKVLPLNKATDESITNFRREIRTQAQLDHANLVRAYDAGEDGNVHYLVVEYVPGADLRRLVRSQRRLTVQQAASIIMQAARGLEHAHQCGLIHRDVKPGNILVTPKGVAKLSDLGLAGFLHNADEDPRAGKIVGTADYLAPERIKSPLEIGPSSDIYSLGCTLYYAVTGKVPFPGGTASSKAVRHCNETPWHPRRFNPDISEEFVEVIADMMEKDPKQRIQSAAEVAARLEPWANDAGPLTSQNFTPSPWLPPPPPAAVVDDEPVHETGSAVLDLQKIVAEAMENASQISQGTDASGGSDSDTRGASDRPQPPAPPPLLPMFPGTGRGLSVNVLLALAIAVPAALMVGAAMGFLVAMLVLGS